MLVQAAHQPDAPVEPDVTHEPEARPSQEPPCLVRERYEKITARLETPCEGKMN